MDDLRHYLPAVRHSFEPKLDKPQIAIDTNGTPRALH